MTTFGESHSERMGCVVDGCPPGLAIDIGFLRSELQRRHGESPYSTARRENDEPEIVSGVLNGKTLGTPITILFCNEDCRSGDYDTYGYAFRPGHGDYVYQKKFGIRDPRGGGRSSARETACRVAAGAIAKLWLSQQGITIQAQIDNIGGSCDYESLLQKAAQEGDSLGGTIRGTIRGVKAGVGEPLYHKLSSALAAAMFSIPSVTGFEIGSGFGAADMKGSQFIDHWNSDFSTQTNHCGGIQAGISNGMPIVFRTALHPIVTIRQGLDCITEHGELRHLPFQGRHDICQVLRAPVIVESMAALTLIDLMLQQPASDL